MGKTSKITYLEFPSTVTEISREAKNICNDYFDKKIDESVLHHYLTKWKNSCGEQFITKDGEFNPTLKIKLGKKRLLLISKILK